MKLPPMLPLSFLLSFGAACAHSPSTNTAEGSKGSVACPDAVRLSVAEKFAGAAMTGCKAEREDGHEQFEVKIRQGSQNVEVDVAPDGTVIQSETMIPIADVPAKVMAAFSARYPGAKSTRVEKQVRPGIGAFYELKFDAQPKAIEVTFAEDGAFVEEE